MKIVTCEKCSRFAEYRRDETYPSGIVICETCGENFQATRAQIAEGERPTREEWKAIAGKLCDALVEIKLIHAARCDASQCKWCQKGAEAHEGYRQIADRERLSGGSA